MGIKIANTELTRSCVYTRGECHHYNSKCSECPFLDHWCDEVQEGIDRAYEGGKADMLDELIEVYNDNPSIEAYELIRRMREN